MKKVSFLFLGLGLIISSIGVGVFAADVPTPTSTAHTSIINQTTDPRLMRPTTGSQSLEKIPHPDYIKYFQEIQKIGSALWGVRKTETTKPTSERNSSDKKVAETSKKTNEKEVKKTERKPEVKPPVKIDASIAQCVKAAVDKKDTTLKASLLTYQTAVITAIDARTTCQKVAIDLTTATDQQAANKSCIETYHRSVWNALNTLKSAKEAGWRTFRTDIKACGGQTTDTSKGEVLVEDGEMQINLKVDMEDDSISTKETTTDGQTVK